MCFSRILAAFFVLCVGVSVSACSQTPAQIVLLGETFYGKEFHASHDASRPVSKSATKTMAMASNITSNTTSYAARAMPAAPHFDTRQSVSVPRVQVSSLAPLERAAPAAAPKMVSSTAVPPVGHKAAGMHQLQSGETLYRLSKQYQVPVDAIKRENNIADASDLSVGQMIRIPPVQQGDGQPMPVQQASAAPAVLQTSKPVTKPLVVAERTVASAPAKEFIWPVNGKVISQFGRHPSGLYNDGINIRSQDGAPVKSTAAGEVIYADNRLEGYGNLVIVRHNNGWLSAYAHNKDLAVKRGDVVSQGQVIAHVGSTGKVSEPQLHFGLRKGKQARNPLDVLNADNYVVASN